MEYSFPHYLLSKQSVDDRALNKDVLSALKANLLDEPLMITEIGGGIGTMLTRLLRWDLISNAKYTLVDDMVENIEFAKTWLPQWAKENDFMVDAIRESPLHLRIFDERHDVNVKLVQADVFDFINQKPNPANLLIAHAFLDLLPMPESLPKLLSLTNNLAWLTINFDGVTTLEPVIDPTLDSKIEQLYHETMDSRSSGGDSQSGRHMFGHLKHIGAEIEAVGSSDWVVYPIDGLYQDDEAYFLQFILHFFEETLGKHPELDKAAFVNWLGKRREQVDRGELVYIAHQMDFLARVRSHS